MAEPAIKARISVKNFKKIVKIVIITKPSWELYKHSLSSDCLPLLAAVSLLQCCNDFGFLRIFFYYLSNPEKL